eukprot:352798-Chlamydomonas_euryale.AAC.2
MLQPACNTTRRGCTARPVYVFTLQSQSQSQSHGYRERTHEGARHCACPKPPPWSSHNTDTQHRHNTGTSTCGCQPAAWGNAKPGQGFRSKNTQPSLSVLLLCRTFHACTRGWALRLVKNVPESKSCAASTVSGAEARGATEPSGDAAGTVSEATAVGATRVEHARSK